MPRFAVVSFVLAVLALAPGAASAHQSFSPGAPGIGDPYFPLAGNGGYDVSHYDLAIRYDPASDRMSGLATISARATQNLSRFNLDFHGLTVRWIAVDRRPASWSRSGDELTVTPRRGLHRGERFKAVIAYDGVPGTIVDNALGEGGWFHTDDGALVVGQPFEASAWYPVNDHPLDKASYSYRITVPAGREAVANGELRDVDTHRGWTTWEWVAREPMASYLTTVTNGDFKLKSYKRDGIRFIDAVDPDLYDESPPRTGSRYALSQKASGAYKRLANTISVPASGGKLTFWVRRDTERNWDFFFVEAHPVGSDAWTTLPDENGHTTQDTGDTCFYSDFLLHYQTRTPDDTCEAGGTTGDWNAVSGTSDGYEQWSVDLGAYAGQQVEVALSYASDSLWQLSGVFVDDVSWPGGSTSFENGADGWHVLAPPADVENENDWIIGGAADAPPTTGEIVDGSLAREPEIIRFLESNFGRYPFSAAGAIIDDAEGLGFALENQTRPIYAKEFFNSAESGDSVIVHELAHQWYGDDVALAKWQYIWLNEGFASYAEWLWSEREGNGTAQELFDDLASIPADDPFWALAIGDPGPDDLFAGQVYERGAMTLHALRMRIGDRAFFRLLQTWARTKSRGNGSIPEFIRLAERISGQQLDAFFDEWLFTAAKPASLGEQAAAARVKRAPARASAQRALHARR